MVLEAPQLTTRTWSRELRESGRGVRLIVSTGKCWEVCRCCKCGAQCYLALTRSKHAAAPQMHRWQLTQVTLARPPLFAP